jgi:hypothetical protein
MKVRLTRKHAERIDGIDLSAHNVGDMIDLPPHEAHLIVAEDWAHPDRRVLATATDHQRRAEDASGQKRSQFPEQPPLSLAADRSRARRDDQDL